MTLKNTYMLSNADFTAGGKALLIELNSRRKRSRRRRRRRKMVK